MAQFYECEFAVAVIADSKILVFGSIKKRVLVFYDWTHYNLIRQGLQKTFFLSESLKSLLGIIRLTKKMQN